MLRLLLVSLVLLTTKTTFAEVIRGSQEQETAISVLDQLDYALMRNQADELRSEVAQLKEKVLNNDLNSPEFINLIQEMLKLDSFQKISQSINNQHMRCIADAAQNGLLQTDANAEHQTSYAISAQQLETLTTQIKNKNKLETKDFIQILILSQLCDGLPFRNLKDPHELAGKVKISTFSFAQLLNKSTVETDEMKLFAEFIAARDVWHEIKLELNSVAQTRRLVDYKYVLKALRVNDDTAAYFNESKINEAESLASLAIEAMKNRDFKSGDELYEAAIRSLFPLSVSKNKNTEELRVLAHIYNTQQHLPAGEKSENLKLKVEEMLRSKFISQVAKDYALTLQNYIETDAEFDSALSARSVIATPDLSIHKLLGFTRAAQGALEALEVEFNKNMTFLQGYKRSYNTKVVDSIHSLKSRFAELESSIAKGESLDAIQRLHDAQNYLQAVVGYYFEAVIQRNTSVQEYHATIDGMISALLNNNFDESFRQIQLKKLRGLMNQDTKENILWKAYLTRNNIAIGALSALIVVEGLTLQIEAMPITLVAISALSKTVLITSSALNLLDRHQRDGIKGLLNIESAMDALTILCLLPKGVAAPVNATSTSGKYLQNARNQWALFSRSGSQLGIYVNLGMGGYQVLMADSIAQRMQEQGVNISADQIRQQGFKNLAFALLFFSMNRLQDARGQKLYGEAYKKEMDKIKFSNSTTGQAFKSLDPRLDGWLPRGLKNYGSAIRDSWNLGTIGGKMSAAWKAVAIPAYQYILANEIFFFSYTTPDFVFENHVKTQRPLPELKGKETAVLFIGLDQADILYAGSRSRDFLRDLTSKYGERFFIYDFSSPHDFIHILNRHSEKHGPIKYLKIVTHGLPGLLATKESASSPIMSEDDSFNHFGERGFISRDFLRKNSSWIKPLATGFMAKDAQIVLISCLVGGNYEDFEKTYGPNQRGANDVGDQFLDEFSTTLLPHGGRVDASNRALIGLNMVFSSLMLHGSMARQYEDLNRQQGILPLSRFKLTDDGIYDRDINYSNETQWTEPEVSMQSFILPLPSQVSVSDEQNPLMFSAQRFVKMIVHFPQVAYAYGVALEGPAWGERYNFRIVNID